MIHLQKSLKKAMLEALIAEDGPLDGAVMMLFNADVTVTENTVLSDLTPCAFSGYAVSDPIVWGDPYLDVETGQWALSCPPVEFRSAGGSPYVPDVVRGYAIYVPGTPNVLRLVEKLTEVVLMDVVDRVIVIRPEIVGLSGSSSVEG